LGALVYGLIESGSVGIADPLVAVALLAGVALSLLFFFVEVCTRDPMLPLSLFRSRNVSGTNLLTLFLYAALSAGLFFFPPNLISSAGLFGDAGGRDNVAFGGYYVFTIPLVWRVD
jgi:hypothetical protein